jgi:hypothetical protein
MTALVVALGLVVLLLAVLVVGLLRSHAEILRALHSLGVDLGPASGEDRADGSALPAPTPGPLGTGVTVPADVSGTDPTGGSISVALAGPDRLTLLAFLSSGCLTCRPMWEAMGDPHAAIPGNARAVAVTKGPHEESPSSVAALASPALTTVMSSEAWASFAVPGSPYFVLVDGQRRIVGEGTAATWQRVLELLGEALADTPEGIQPPSGPPRGGGAARLQHVDDTLRAAGIEAGHPSLHSEP